MVVFFHFNFETIYPLLMQSNNQFVTIRKVITQTKVFDVESSANSKASHFTWQVSVS